jgi:hypothetical protein
LRRRGGGGYRLGRPAGFSNPCLGLIGSREGRVFNTVLGGATIPTDLERLFDLFAALLALPHGIHLRFE